MIVGICRIVLSLPGNDSLKGKRKVVRQILDRVRHKFNAAASEVDDMDVHQRAVLGIAVVSNDTSHANSMLDTIASFIAGATEARVVGRKMELRNVGVGEHLEDLETPGLAGPFDEDPWDEDDGG
jgi:uncharacterized protein YlxP (DUF503 family)